MFGLAVENMGDVNLDGYHGMCLVYSLFYEYS